MRLPMICFDPMQGRLGHLPRAGSQGRPFPDNRGSTAQTMERMADMKC